MREPGIGVTVLPEWLQVEGVERVLDNLQAARVTAVSTSPYVMAPADPGAGGREPPADGGAGQVRLLDRALWDGRRALDVVTAPSFAPNRALYRDLPYQPAEPTALTERAGHVVADFVHSARRRGLEVYLQVMAAIPPGYRVQFGGPRPEDEPRLPEGGRVPDRVDKNGSLAAPAVRAYTSALLRDLSATYPEVDGFRLDWPEYPPYALDAVFFDFSEHAVALGERLGFDVAAIRDDVAAFRRWLDEELGNADLDALASTEGQAAAAARLLVRFPQLSSFLDYKRALTGDFLNALPRDKALVPQVFPPPWLDLSGFDPEAEAERWPAIGVKLYTMHWPMILRAWADTLLGRRPQLDPGRLVGALHAVLALGGPHPGHLHEVRYPEPDEPHPVGPEAQATKIGIVRAATAGRCPVFAIAHGYGPLEDVVARARIAYEASGGRLWINRYGYLSDDKLKRIAALVA